MRSFLLDANVISELTRVSPDAGVVSFLSEQENLWLSSVVPHELEFGIRCLPSARRRDRLQNAIAALVASFEDPYPAGGAQGSGECSTPPGTRTPIRPSASSWRRADCRYRECARPCGGDSECRRFRWHRNQNRQPLDPRGALRSIGNKGWLVDPAEDHGYRQDRAPNEDKAALNERDGAAHPVGAISQRLRAHRAQHRSCAVKQV